MDSLRVVRGVRIPPLDALVWFVYLLGIPITLASEHASAQRWAIEFAGLAVFLGLYVLNYQVCGWPSLGPIVGILGLGLIAMHWDLASMAYVIFGASFFGWSFRENVSLAYRLLAAYLCVFGAGAFAEHINPFMIGMTFVLTALVGFLQVRMAIDHRTTTRLRLAYDEVERLAKVAERERIARDLHDVLGHTLSLIVLKSELASKLAGTDPAAATREIRDVEQIARTSLGEVRSALAGYRGAGIAAEIDHAREVFASAGITLECEASDLRVPAHYEGVLSLAIREAVTNVVRHADARAVRLILRAEQTGYRFEIIDDGRGAKGPDGAGLRGMRERVESLGGVLERSVGNGTRLVVSLPAGAPS